MKKYILLLVSLTALTLAGCSDFLDRPQKSAMDDTNYWTNENNLRFFANGYYINYFTGYYSGWSVPYVPLRGYYFSDDFTSAGTQSHFETAARLRDTVPLKRLVCLLNTQDRTGTLLG